MSIFDVWLEFVTIWNAKSIALCVFCHAAVSEWFRKKRLSIELRYSELFRTVIIYSL